MRILDNLYLGWDPFGMVMTVGDMYPKPRT